MSKEAKPSGASTVCACVFPLARLWALTQNIFDVAGGFLGKEKTPPSNQLNWKLQICKQLPFWFWYWFLPNWIVYIAPYCWCLGLSCPLMTWDLTVAMVCSEEALTHNCSLTHNCLLVNKQTLEECVPICRHCPLKNLNWWPIWMQEFFCVFKYHLSWEVPITEMNRRPHWDLIREGGTGEVTVSMLFWSFAPALVSISCSHTINILYLVLIEAVTLVRHIIASWPKEKCSYISLLAVICQVDWLRLYPETLHIQQSSCFHMSWGESYHFSERHEVRGTFSVLAFLLHVSGGSHYNIPSTYHWCENWNFYNLHFVFISLGDRVIKLLPDMQQQLLSICPLSYERI